MSLKRDSALASTFNNYLASLVALIAGIISGILITRSLGPELRGEYANIRLVTTLYAPLLLFGYQGGVLFYGIRKQINLIEFYWTGWLVSGVIAIIIPIILYPLISLGLFGSIIVQTNSMALIVGLLSIPLLLLNSYCERILRSYHLFIASNKRIIVGGIVTLLYYAIFFFLNRLTLLNVLWGVVLGQAIQQAMNIFYIIRYIEVKFVFTKKDVTKPWGYGIKEWINSVLNNSNDKFDQIILSFLLNASSFGIYTVGVSLSNLLTTIPSSYLSVFYNQVVDKEIKEALILYAKAQRIIIMITACMCLLLAILAYPLILFMYGRDFIQAAGVVALYAIGLIFQVAARLSIKFYAGIGRPLKISLIYIAGLIVSIPFYFLLIPKYGVFGAAIASSIAYISSFLFSYFQLNRDFNLPLSAIINFQKEDFVYLKSQLYRLPVIGKFISRYKMKNA